MITTLITHTKKSLKATMAKKIPSNPILFLSPKIQLLGFTRLMTFFFLFTSTTFLHSQKSPDYISYQTACDASAAVTLSKKYFVLGNDEDNILRFYHWEKPAPIAVMDLGTQFSMFGRRPNTEMDIEGAAKLGKYAYWIGSHGRSSKGKLRAARYSFFATKIKPNESGLNQPNANKPYSLLVEAMLQSKAIFPDKDTDLYGIRKSTRIHQKRKTHLAPKNEGFNIEGLSQRPQGGLFIGLRNPRPGNKALLIPFLNPQQVWEKGQVPLFKKPIKLDLGGLGIRDLYYDKNLRGTFIIAGSHNNDDEYALYFYTNSGKLKKLPLNFPKSFKPEAVMVRNDTQELVFLSDDGRLEIKGTACKELFAQYKNDVVYFRSLRYPLKQVMP